MPRRSGTGDGADFVNRAAVAGDMSSVPVPSHCTDYSSVPLTRRSTELGASPSTPDGWAANRLTDAQVAHYNEHGWVSGVRILSQAQVDALLADVDQIAAGHEARGLLYEYHSNQSGDPNAVLMHALGQWRLTPRFHALAYHPAVTVAASQLLGSTPLRLFHDQLFCKPARVGGGVAWHQDYSYWTRTTPMQHVTVHVALDEQTADNGPLAFVSGSHRWQRADGAPGPLPIVDENFADAEAILGVLSAEQRASFAPTAIRLKPGEASFHHPLTIHGSAPNRSDGPRRATVLNYFSDGTTSATDEPLLPGALAPRGAPIRGRFFPLVYDPAWSCCEAEDLHAEERDNEAHCGCGPERRKSEG